MDLVYEAVEAHGGSRLWRGIQTLEAEVSARGLLFGAKQRPTLERVRVRAATTTPRLQFVDFPLPGLHSRFLGDREVRISDASGTLQARRERPRDSFWWPDRQLWWDRLDFTYFAGYALWNYLTLPFSLLRPGFAFEILEPLPAATGDWLRLKVTFPADLPTHSRTQVLYFDDDRHLKRMDYTAEVVGLWARAAHLCEDYRDFGGLRAPTRRQVVPQGPGGWSLPGPTLVGLELHDLRALA